jgi:O-antigen ligase
LNLERIQLGLLAAAASACFVSIFTAQTVLAVAAAVYGLRLVRADTRLPRTSLDKPLLALCVWSLLSASFAHAPLTSHREAKQLVLLAVFYIAVDALGCSVSRERVLGAAMLGGLVLATGCIVQFYALGFDTMQNRPRGFLGHYMTASGLLMGVLLVSTARLLLRRGPWSKPSAADLKVLVGVAAGLALVLLLQRVDLFAVEGLRLFIAALVALAVSLALSRGRWPGPATADGLAALALPLSAWALLLTRTRNAWLGALVGLAILAALRTPKVLLALAGAVAVLLVVRPAPIVERLTMSDVSSRDRYYMWQAGIDMILERPVFGQGPGMIVKVYPSYRWPEAPNPQAPHLHNNALQIAAERGLPCLVWWLWLVAAALAQALRRVRADPPTDRWAAALSLAWLVALLAAGMFEYNFGDSEVLLFTLLVTALPFARGAASSPGPARRAV